MNLRTSLLSIFSVAGLAATAPNLNAAISVVQEGGAFVANADAAAGQLFNAGAADKLIVTYMTEIGDFDQTVFYGVTLGTAVELIKVANTANARSKGVFYLDNPAATGNLYFGGGIGGSGLIYGAVSILGSAAGVDSGNAADALSVDLNPSVAGSFVVTSHTNNTTNAGASSVSVPSGHTPLVINDDWNGDGASAYRNGVGTGMQTFTYTDSQTPALPSTNGAVFSPIPEPSTVTLLSLPACLALLRRRRA